MRWYFDYISPYAYLQSKNLDTLNKLEPIVCTPILFSGLLKHWEHKGPAEIEPKRNWTFREIAWLAHRDNIPLNLPEMHPFNPLPLLRLGILFNNEITVVQRLFNFVWAEGYTPQNESAFNTLLDELGTDADDLNKDSVKKQLHQNGTKAIESGVFGVPSIEYKNEVFWGYSSTDMITAALASPNNYPADAIKKAELLPQGIHRKQHPNHPGKAEPTANRSEPRIKLKPIDLAEPADLVNAIRKRRGGELLELDRLLLYSRPLAEGWNHFLGNIRENFSVERKLRELAMCTVAVLNRAEYEFSQHAPLYIKAGGTEEKTKLLRQPDTAQKNALFTDKEQLTIALTTQMTIGVQIDETLFDQAMALFGDEHLVELIATIAAYNMVSRFLVAFELHPS